MRLPNGLRLHHVCLPHLHQAAFALITRSGPRYEPPELNGISHFVEHMLFQGSVGLSAVDYHAALDDLAAEMNACTVRDAVTVSGVTPVASLTPTLLLLASVLTAPRWDSTCIEVERNVIAEELLETLDYTGTCVDLDTITKAALWPRFGQPILGTLDTISAFKREELQRWHRRCFVGANMVLVTAGPQPPDWRVWQALGAIPAGRPLRGPPPRVCVAPDPIIVADGDAAQASVQLTWPISALSPAANLLVPLLDGSYGSYLRRQLIEERGLCYHAEVALDDYGDAAALDVVFDCAPSKVAAAVQVTTQALRQYVPTNAEMTRAKRRLQFEQAKQLDDPLSLVETLANDLLLDAPSLSAAQSVTVADIQRLLADLGQPQLAIAGVSDTWHSTCRTTSGCTSSSVMAGTSSCAMRT